MKLTEGRKVFLMTAGVMTFCYFTFFGINGRSIVNKDHFGHERSATIPACPGANLC